MGCAIYSLIDRNFELWLLILGLPLVFLDQPFIILELRSKYARLRLHPFASATIVLASLLLSQIIAVTNIKCLLTFVIIVMSLQLWYQVGVTSFSQVARRIFWFAWHAYQRQGFPCQPSYAGHENGLPVPAGISRGWPYLLAKFSRRTRRQHAIRDLGRLGAHARSPRESHLVLVTLTELAKVIPLDTSGVSPPIQQLCEATLQSLWPIKSSDAEAFRLAIRVFDTVLKRWAQARQQVKRASGNNGCQEWRLVAKPFLSYLVKLGQALAEYHPYLLRSDEFLRVFDATDQARDNHQEAEALFEIGMHALRLGRWEPLLHITKTLHRYAQVGVGAWREDVPLVQAAQDAYERRQELDEGFIWYLGLVAMIVHTAPATLPWVRRELGLHEPLCAHDQVNRRAWEAVCHEAARFFTRRVLRPTVAAAVTCLCAHMCAPHTAAEPLPCDALGGGTATPPPAQGPQGAS